MESRKFAQGFLSRSLRSRRTADETLKLLQRNEAKFDKDIEEACTVEGILETEYNAASEVIKERAAKLRTLVDAYVEHMKVKLKINRERNLETLKQVKETARQRLKKLRSDIEKLTEVVKPDVTSGSLVNKVKVVEMVLQSIDVASAFNTNKLLVRTELNIRTQTLNDETVKQWIGDLNESEVQIIDILYPVKCVGQITSHEDTDINAMSVCESGELFVNFGASHTLTQLSKGKSHNVLNAGFPIDDLITTPDGKIICTSKDSFKIHCFSPKRKQPAKFDDTVLVKDSLHLHGLTLCNLSGVFAVCGTDKPNYSDEKSNETVIMEYTFTGKEVKRLMISGYTGKVYRMSQNINNEYILTFPKEGTILSVNTVGKIQFSFSNEDFIRVCAPSKTSSATRLHMEEQEVAFWPSGIACNAIGHVFVSDWLNKTVLMFDEKLSIIRTLGDRFFGPNALCYDKKNNALVVSDRKVIQLWKTT
ncbi:hypothetical protein DPMN_126548 [Dreissena polymorpha]|uniref:Uncharacterized protein n=1 Tax=Dreissena polymorpha TaxID=45954 RepID=A0A9D4H087_DREPO|nr:hypothetical protein DPMN_126548 [Dreissena polymorpha]